MDDFPKCFIRRAPVAAKDLVDLAEAEGDEVADGRDRESVHEAVDFFPVVVFEDYEVFWHGFRLRAAQR